MKGKTMPTAKRRATYADIEALPEHLVGEIIDGELFVSPRPNAEAVRFLSLDGFLREGVPED